jgi:ribosomal protein S12 methylthiotransferase
MAARSTTIRTVAFISLGCPKNLVDSERMLGLLAQDGLTITNDPARADAIVINTCGFLEAAKDESLEAIRQAVAFKQTGRCQRVVVAGCLAQRHKTRLLEEVPQIDRLVGVFDREHIVPAVRDSAARGPQDGHYLGKYHKLSKGAPAGAGIEAQQSFDDRARLRLTPRHFAYLRISEGCSQGCSFCTIPSIRGPMRSKPPQQILAEAQELVADGAVELNLIGQDTTSYGKDIGYEPGLAGLLRLLDRELVEVPWLRLMYAYPSCFSDEMIDAMAQCQRVVKYIDIPLQHIDDQVLLRMRRRVTRQQTEALLRKLRQRIPTLAIRTTFITGSPGETDQQHQALLQFVREFRFDMMGVFAYSREDGTAMGRMDQQVSDQVKQQRLAELMLAQQEIAFAKARSARGSQLTVLIDRRAGRDHEDGWIARSAAQAPEIDPVVRLHGRKLHVGQMLDVTVVGSEGYDLLAKVPPSRPKLRVLS